MAFEDYVSCIESRGIQSGAMFSYIDFATGSGYFCSNARYTLEEQVLSGYPIIDKLPAIIVRSEGDFVSKYTGSFSGDGLVHISNSVNPNSFSVMVDLEASLCQLETNQKDGYVILSTRTSGEQQSGFLVGVNRAGRLFLEYKNSDGETKSFSLSSEAPQTKTIIVSQDEEFVSIGYHDIEIGDFLVQSKNISDCNRSDSIYIGGDFDLSDTNYTGVSGHFKRLAYLGFPIDQNQKLTLCDCLFSTGDYSVDGVISFSVPITGTNIYTSGESGVSSYQYQQKEVDGKTVYYSSGVSGSLSTYTAYEYLTGAALYTTGSYQYVGYNNALKGSRYFRTISLARPLESGDIIEIKSRTFNDETKNIRMIDFEIDRLEKDSILLYHNGILNVEGIDFTVDVNNNVIGTQIQGYDSSDFFTYTPTNKNIISSLYSGQFPSSGGDTYITGISGYVLTGYDVYFNGQKLVIGYDYTTGVTGSQPSIIILSGEVPEQDAEAIPRIEFVEVTGWGDIYAVSYYCTGSCNDFAFSGVDEDVWVNGVKQVDGLNYTKYFPCSLNNDISEYQELSYLIFNNQSDNFNI